MTDPVSGRVVGTTTGTPASSTENFGAGMGKDTFLKLLVAQLKYQNPLQPTDSQQYMAQMAQFTTVEKLADIQKSQTDLAGWQRTVAGQGMVGKEITATLSSGQGEVTGKVTGLRLTEAGPRLVLENGTTVSVDEVTDVKLPASATTSAPAPTAPAATPPATTPAASTPAATTPAATTPPASTPPAAAPAAPTTPPATSAASGTAATTGSTGGTTTGTGPAGGPSTGTGGSTT